MNKNYLTHTAWTEDLPLPHYPSLTEDINCDVCVIGAGIAGLTTAYLLVQKNLKVCVLESLNLADGQTGHTTAHVTAVLDTFYTDIIKMHGENTARKVADSHIAAMNTIKTIIRNENFDCDLTELNGYLCTNDQNSNRERLDDELSSVHAMGFYGVYGMLHSPLRNFTSGPCLVFPQQLQFHPVKYLRKLASCISTRGGQIFCQSPVKEVKENKAISQIEVHTNTGRVVRANSVVVATNSPVTNTFVMHTKQAPYRTYALAFKVPRNIVPMGLYWDTEKPYHHVRIQPYSPTKDLMIVGGEDHKTGQNDHPELCFEHLTTWTTKKFPFVEEIVHHWSGQVLETVDGLPYLGRNPMDNPNVYIITGHSGVGMTQSTLGAMIVTDQIMNVSNPWEEIYNPSRFPLKALGHYLRENANVAAQYAEWITPQMFESVEHLQVNEGIVINHGMKKIAVYRTASGELEAYSAACTHLGGVVHWNSVEKSWDCPCHGSRYDCHGKVIEGPAIDDLKAVEDNLEPEAEPIDPSERQPIPPQPFLPYGYY